MKEIGEFLKESRVENGVSIEEASDDLNVTSSEIENLEEGNVKAFKDVYYLKSLVKEYSKYLGQDPDHILDEFNDFMFWSGQLFNNVKSLIENIEKDDNCYVVVISPKKTISEIFIPDNMERLKKYLMMFIKDKHTSWEVIYKRERINI